MVDDSRREREETDRMLRELKNETLKRRKE